MVIASIRKLQRALSTTAFDAAGEGSAKACWATHAPSLRADKFRGPQALPQNLRRFSGLRLAHPKNRTAIGPHPRGAKRPLISTTEIGYVRRSEIT